MFRERMIRTNVGKNTAFHWCKELELNELEVFGTRTASRRWRFVAVEE
jgi:hypothetical protein